MSIIDVTNNYLNKLRKGLVSRKLFARRKPTIAQNHDGRLEVFAVVQMTTLPSMADCTKW